MADVYAKLEENPLVHPSVRWSVGIHHHGWKSKHGDCERLTPCAEHLEFASTEEKAREVAQSMLATHPKWCELNGRRVVIVEGES